MRRVRIILLTLCSVLVAVLIAAWIRSHFAYDEIAHARAQDRVLWVFAHGGGDVVIVRFQTRYGLVTAWSYGGRTPLPARTILPDRVVGLFGYGICHMQPNHDILKYDAVVLPYWFLTFLSATPWLIYTWRYWRQHAARRIAAGLCPACGYDLRASANRCPECGADAPLPRPSPA